MKAFAETFNECVFLENLYISDIYIYIYIYIRVLRNNVWIQNLFEKKSRF